MLKFKIDNDTFNALDDNQKPFYEQVGDEFVLKVDGMPQADDSEVERLRLHNEKLIGEKRQRDEVAKQAQLERERIEQEAAKKNGDFEALEKSYQEKIAASDARIAEMTKIEERRSIERESGRLASELADNPKNQRLLQKFINDRLTVVDGQVKVTDEQGKPSINTLNDLANEFKSSGDYDSLLTGTGASGSGGSGQGVSAAKSASEYTEAEMVQLAQTNPEEFKRQFKT